MSNIYIQEPPTNGKVLLKTSVGDIDIELWSKECPQACRNFVQLCLEGYYDGTIFHRVVKGFIVQGGDPNGDGTGGESVYGRPFKDEFHSRLRYVRRGLVGMANSAKNDNGSQFFFTLSSTPELQNQNTLFGKVTGDTIYNMLKLEEGEVYENEKPHFPHRIIRTEVLSNPFDDIVPRTSAKAADKAKQESDERANRKRKGEKGVKNFGLLSFGDEAEEEEQEANVFVQKAAGSSRGKSSHDVLDDPKLSKQSIAVPESRHHKAQTASSDEEEAGAMMENRRGKSPGATQEDIKNVREKLKRKPEEEKKDKRKGKEEAKSVSTHGDAPDESDSDPEDYGLDSERKRTKRAEAEKIREEIVKLKRDYRTDKRSKDKEKEAIEAKASKKESRKEVMSEVLRIQEEYSQKTKQLPKKGSSRESFTMQLLEKFKSKLHSVNDREPATVAGADVADEEQEIQGDDWLAHRLEFDRKDPILAKDAATKADDWYDVYDPRNPLNKRKRGEAGNADKKLKK
ncbi:spliceosome-associated protein CWC27 homolog [Anopheles darlingi]|uniref:spliceosome-associated protein CWC27 homolog n=1 Tax=Anopheles darlingi TaxID=43151 RepID=UPI0021005D91|nr:spliceosome-associated protein CWC27 homolog [Anopheles darlingi]